MTTTRLQLRPIEQQVMVITGASSGIGLATAELAARKGASLVLSSRNGEALGEIAGRLRDAGSKVEVVVADVADEEAANKIADVAISTFGRVDSWVNNAATSLYGELVEIDANDHRRVFDVGYFGTVRGALKAVELMREQGGAVINLGSVLSERTMILQGSYSAMKHAVKGFTDGLRMELQEQDVPISVTLIKPTGMHTPYAEHARNLMDKPATVPPVVYDPRLVARAIVFAAQNPRRELTVGGNGLMVSVLGKLMPSLADKAMAMVGRTAQQIDTPAPPGTRDNLWEPRRDGNIDSEQDIPVRKQSLWLEAQMRPVAAAAIAAITLGLSALAINAALRSRDDAVS